MFLYESMGNKFVLIKSEEDHNTIYSELPSRVKINIDGIIIFNDNNAVYMNKDGSIATFCANGARCYIYHLYKIYKIPTSGTIKFGSENVKYQVKNKMISLSIGDSQYINNFNIRLLGNVYLMHLLKYGVEHFIIEDKENNIDIDLLVKDYLKEKYTYNLSLLKGDNLITFERGVGRTENCGTASACLLKLLNKNYNIKELELKNSYSNHLIKLINSEIFLVSDVREYVIN